MTLRYQITVEPRYLKHNSPWKIFTFNKLPESVQQLYVKQGIDKWMRKNVMDALYNATVSIQSISVDHKLTMIVTLSQDVVQDYIELFSSCSRRQHRKRKLEQKVDEKAIVLQGLHHYLEQSKDLGNDSSQWAYGVSVNAETHDEMTDTRYTMVFKILKIKQLQ